MHVRQTLSSFCRSRSQSGAVQTREIARELLEVFFETMTWPEAEDIPVSGSIVDGPDEHSWTVTIEGKEKDVRRQRARILRRVGARTGHGLRLPVGKCFVDLWSA